MDMRMMGLATAVVTVERLAPQGEDAASVIGAIVVATGWVLTAPAIGLA